MKIKKLSKKQLIAFIIVAVLLVVTVPTGIYCGVKHETPAQVVSKMFSDQDKLINKWQSEKAASAYEFREDGTYESYISTFSFTGNYKVEGKKLTLFNPGSNSQVVYKYDIGKKDNIMTLTLVLLEQNGTEAEDKEEVVYKQVDHINTKSITDLFSDYANDIKDEESTEKDK
ncbi:MAG: hypothetical protein IJ077_04830 [Eubacterium sp.]|nr:hypothetical protein [Eubacterium sp.]MBR2279073.1 hypothetical protein [Eubacterium sp.]